MPKSSKNIFWLVFASIFTFAFLLPAISLASNDNGTIDGSFRYAWGENVGFVDFGSTAGNVHVTDSALSGYAYGENIGWLDLSAVANDNQGALSGYAWGENVGWVDFSEANIGSDGIFTGGIYGENTGWITFGTGSNKVVTDWRPANSRSSGSSGSSQRSSVRTAPISNTPAVNTQINTSPSVKQNEPSKSYNLGTATLKNGSRGEPVKDLQTFLNAKLNLTLAVDGKLGPKTKQAVIIFQKANNLVPDGIVGPKTKAVINAIITN